MGCVMVAHVYAVSMEMALITLMMILVVAVLYYGFGRDSWLMILTPFAFLFKGALCGCIFSRAGRQSYFCNTCKLRRFFILSSYVYTPEQVSLQERAA